MSGKQPRKEGEYENKLLGKMQNSKRHIEIS